LRTTEGEARTSTGPRSIRQIPATRLARAVIETLAND
jgi:hypothetical protein